MTDDTNKEDDVRLKRLMNLTLGVAVAFSILLPLAYWIWFSLINNAKPALDPTYWGTFGDFIGGVLNPFVAFMALFWLTRSISIQREELRDTKLTLEKANVSQQQQAKTAEKQSFEDTFFALLDQHNKVLGTLQNKEYSGSTESTIQLMHRLVLSQRSTSLQDASSLFKQFDELSGHYFRILYQLLKLISINAPNTTLGSSFSGDHLLASIPSASEKLYSNIVRSFLSSSATQLLAINCYCSNQGSTYWNYKCLVERYALLEHMPFTVGGLIHPALRESVTHYERIAFGQSEFLSTLETT